MKLLSLTALILFSTGCNLLVTKDEVRLDHTLRPVSGHVEVYKDTVPTQHYITIAEMSWSGPRSDELRAQRYFMTRAEKLGASAILFTVGDAQHERNLNGVSGVGGALISSATSTQYLFKAKAILYEP